MIKWMDEKRVLAATYQLQEDQPDDQGGLEHVEKLQKRLDDFQKVEFCLGTLYTDLFETGDPPKK